MQALFPHRLPRASMEVRCTEHARNRKRRFPGYLRKAHFRWKQQGINLYPYDLFIEMFHVKHKGEGCDLPAGKNEPHSAAPHKNAKGRDQGNVGGNNRDQLTDETPGMYVHDFFETHHYKGILLLDVGMSGNVRARTLVSSPG